MFKEPLSQDRRQGIGMTSERTRLRMIEEIRELGIKDLSVLHVMSKLPRHVFVDEAFASRAYENTALPIGHGQTISQPYTVALMTQTLLNKPRKHILEIGSGCGYQTAVLSQLVESIISIECILKLHRTARDTAYDLGIRNVKFRHGDGFSGAQEFAPFDGIIAAAVSDDIPDELIEQLAEGGRIVMPVSKNGSQWLVVADKINGQIVSHDLEAVRFVPRLSGLY